MKVVIDGKDDKHVIVSDEAEGTLYFSLLG